jgi:hypothetical protein
MLLGDFNAKTGREDIKKKTTGNESVHEFTNDNGVRVVNFATYKESMFLHCHFHKFAWTSDEKTQSD